MSTVDSMFLAIEEEQSNLYEKIEELRFENKILRDRVAGLIKENEKLKAIIKELKGEDNE